MCERWSRSIRKFFPLNAFIHVTAVFCLLRSVNPSMKVFPIKKIQETLDGNGEIEKTKKTFMLAGDG